MSMFIIKRLLIDVSLMFASGVAYYAIYIYIYIQLQKGQRETGNTDSGCPMPIGDPVENHPETPQHDRVL